MILSFFLYSFLGFLLEVLYARLLGRGGRGRKCLLFLPLCPVYGIACAAILQMPPLLLSRPTVVFAAGGLLATLAEYAVGALYLWGPGVRFWDYSDRPGNLSGLICPLYTFFWGALSLVLVYGLHPTAAPLLALVPQGVIPLLFSLFAADGLISLCLLRRSRTPDCLMWYRAFPRPGKAGM